MLPTHGAASGTFLLSNAARATTYSDAASWIGGARARSSFLAGALNLETCANELVRLNLAELVEKVVIRADLARLSDAADRATLTAIAGILLAADPPPWLTQAVQGRDVRREYIPSRDLAALSWLDPMLDDLLIVTAGATLKADTSELLTGLGLAGELIIMQALTSCGFEAIHVALISDMFGYDIEVLKPCGGRIEVKTTTEANAGAFHISRHEYETSLRFGDGWHLLQVVLSPAVLEAPTVRAEHVKSINRLIPGALREIVAPDTGEFRWSISASVAPRRGLWAPSSLYDSAGGLSKGVRELGRSGSAL